MSMSAIGGCSATQAQATQYQSSTRASASATATTTSSTPDGSSFISAIASALSDIGVTTASSSSATSDTSTDPAKALGDFLQTLIETMQSQGGGMEADLQSLIASLGTDDTAAITSDSSTSNLDSSFKNLLGALGVDSADSGSKRSQFLQTLSAKLESSGPAGNLVNTLA